MGDNGTARDKDTGGSVRVHRSFGILGRGPILTYHMPIRQEGARVNIIGFIVMNIIGGIRYHRRQLCREDLHGFAFWAFDMYIKIKLTLLLFLHLSSGWLSVKIHVKWSGQCRMTINSVRATLMNSHPLCP